MTIKAIINNALIFVATVTVMSTAAMAQTQVTFTKDVAPILQEKCQTCHRPGTVAPMSLLTYQQTRAYANEIKKRVVARTMPPWFIDKNVGIQHFQDDESLTDQQVATIVKWVDEGAPQGSPADMPAPAKFPDAQAWQIEKPDITFTLPKALIEPAINPDWYPNVLVDPHLTEDRYIKAVQIIPTDAAYRVIHHMRSSVVDPDNGVVHKGAGPDAEVSAGEQGVWLAEYAIGKGPDVFSDGSGRLIKAGSKINLQFHIHADGKVTPVNLTVGLKFYPPGYVPQHVVQTIAIGSDGHIDIRPNEIARSDGYFILPHAARILSFQPHMHLRGKAECMEAIYPQTQGMSQHRETLSCATFLFNWMRNYVYADDAAPLLPKGTIIHTIMWHDNTAANKANPDPDAEILSGGRTVDEMGHAYLNLYYMSDDAFKKEVAERKVMQPSEPAEER